jgi:type II secretory pathway pseudopilin PulG
MNTKGFTLFESMLYIALMGVVLATLSSFVMQLMHARVKLEAKSEVLHAARLVEMRISDALRHANSINVGTSVFGSDPGVLSLEMQDPLKNPTIFRLNADNGRVEMSEHGGAYVALTSTRLSATNLVFQNLTSADDTGVVQVLFTLQTVNPTNIPYYHASTSFQSSYRIPLP